jgi:hypothetical protein
VQRREHHRLAMLSLQRRWDDLIAREPLYRRDAGAALMPAGALAV